MVIFRLDANPKIGSGHVARCLAVASELSLMGEDSLIVVSDETSAGFLSSYGIQTKIVEGNPMALGSRDGDALASLCCEAGASAVLVDTYAATDAFFRALTRPLRDKLLVAHIDDCYTFSEGKLDAPRDHGAGLIVNYGFAFSESDYNAALERGATVLVGPRYAPIRAGFSGGFRIRDKVSCITVTSGSTNPNYALEKMSRGVLLSDIDANLVVVVGRQASFDEGCLTGHGCTVLCDVADMAGLMRRSDIVVSAAGTTLYELASVGVPTIALPIVENQIPNAEGFKRLGLGFTTLSTNWGAEEVSSLLLNTVSIETRRKLSGVLSSMVDGAGAKRIAEALRAQRRLSVLIGES